MLTLNNYNQQIQLIVALGNIGKEYTNTRHNAGFMFSQILTQYLNAQGSISQHKHTSLFELYTYPDHALSLLEPLTYMNESGKALSSYIKNSALKNIPDYASKILLVHDDLDLKIGTYKLQKAKAPKKHNGLKSIDETLGEVAQEFYRLRIGIENREVDTQISGMDYVLMRFSNMEMEQLKTLFATIIENEFSL